MRTMTLDEVIKFSRTKEKDELVERVIKSYNERNPDRPAIRGGSRRPRNPDEQRVLDSFNLK